MTNDGFLSPIRRVARPIDETEDEGNLGGLGESACAMSPHSVILWKNNGLGMKVLRSGTDHDRTLIGGKVEGICSRAVESMLRIASEAFRLSE